MLACDCISREIHIVIHRCWNFFCADIICVYLLLLFTIILGSVYSRHLPPPPKTYNFPPNRDHIVCSKSFLAGAMIYKYIMETFF